MPAKNKHILLLKQNYPNKWKFYSVKDITITEQSIQVV